MKIKSYNSKKMYCDTKFNLIKNKILEVCKNAKTTESRVYIDIDDYRIVLNKQLNLVVIYEEFSDEIYNNILEFKNIIIKYLDDFEFI